MFRYGAHMLDTPNRDQSGFAWLSKRLGSAEPAMALRKIRPILEVAWRWRFRAPALLAAVAVGWYFGVPFAFGPVVYVQPVIRAEFVQGVVASGHIEAPFRVNIGSQITGVVMDVPVEEGQSVKAGDILIVLDDREAKAVVVQAEGAVAQAEARLRQLRELTLPSAEEALAQAKATLLNAQQAYERAAQLAGKGVATKATLDDATRALNIARAQVRSAEFQVFTNQSGGSDYVMAETLLNQARANLITAQSRLSYTVIKAPRDGVLIWRDVERGNVVQPNNVLMRLSPFVDTQLTVQIDERNLGLLRVGEKALVSADAYPKELFEAQVIYINPGVDVARASVEVKLRVLKPPAYLRQDMTVSVDIETARHSGALIVSAESVRGLSGGHPWVMKVEGRHTKRRAVSVGLIGGGKVEILDGLKEGDLLVPATVSLKENVRIRPRTLAASVR
jgi:HlyD family secretion protein